MIPWHVNPEVQFPLQFFLNILNKDTVKIGRLPTLDLHVDSLVSARYYKHVLVKQIIQPQIIFKHSILKIFIGFNEVLCESSNLICLMKNKNKTVLSFDSNYQ